ncbi:hypothetical protein BDW74DRAFT_155897 [Aspergillus multicolor]|uniref:uncharacterized protein n=1 Tax=Aspergillus multicolor TaxID=41759 RepID=UPI003CCD32AC
MPPRHESKVHAWPNSDKERRAEDRKLQAAIRETGFFGIPTPAIDRKLIAGEELTEEEFPTELRGYGEKKAKSTSKSKPKQGRKRRGSSLSSISEVGSGAEYGLSGVRLVSSDEFDAMMEELSAHNSHDPRVQEAKAKLSAKYLEMCQESLQLRKANARLEKELAQVMSEPLPEDEDEDEQEMARRQAQGRKQKVVSPLPTSGSAPGPDAERPWLLRPDEYTVLFGNEHSQCKNSQERTEWLTMFVKLWDHKDKAVERPRGLGEETEWSKGTKAKKGRKNKDEKEYDYTYITNYDVTTVHLDRENSGTIPIYDTPAVIRAKISAFLDQTGMETPDFLKEISKTLPNQYIGKTLTRGTLSNFMGKSGVLAGNQSLVFYAAYVFEKTRVRDGKPKTKLREEMENVWGSAGFDRQMRGSEQYYVKKGKELYRDEFGKVYVA